MRKITGKMRPEKYCLRGKGAKKYLEGNKKQD